MTLHIGVHFASCATLHKGVLQLHFWPTSASPRRRKGVRRAPKFRVIYAKKPFVIVCGLEPYGRRGDEPFGLPIQSVRNRRCRNAVSRSGANRRRSQFLGSHQSAPAGNRRGDLMNRRQAPFPFRTTFQNGPRHQGYVPENVLKTGKDFVSPPTNRALDGLWPFRKPANQKGKGANAKAKPIYSSRLRAASRWSAPSCTAHSE